MISVPKTGNVVNKMGNNAQCMAQAIEVAIPSASQFNLRFIKSKDIIFAIMLQILSRKQNCYMNRL